MLQRELGFLLWVVWLPQDHYASNMKEGVKQVGEIDVESTRMKPSKGEEKNGGLFGPWMLVTRDNWRRGPVNIEKGSRPNQKTLSP